MRESQYKPLILPVETERFTNASGPVKIIMREGKLLERPEVIEIGPPPVISVYEERRKRMREGK